MKKFTAEEQIKLRDFTDNVYPQGSFAFSRLLRDRDIRVNGKKTGENILLCQGDEIVYYTTEKEEQKKFFDVVYEDENIVVADKYAGVNAEALAFTLFSACGARAVHRLDRNTRGLTVFAKNAAAEQALLDAFRCRRVEKIYEAVCFHPFEKKAGILTAYLRKDACAARVCVSAEERKGADKIVTEYFDAENRGEFSRVKIRLHSGKTHQIRAHMAFIGHPVAGDEKYGDEALNKKYRLKRHILVAKSLSFSFADTLSYLNGMKFVSAFSAEYPSG